MKNYTDGLSHRSYESELWHSIDIEPFTGIYEVSNYGRIRSHHNNKWSKTKNYKILKLQRMEGYPCIILHKDKQIKMIRVHRLVAEYFVHNPDPKNKTWVNHLDCDRTNNHYENLEWCTMQENVDHAWKMGRCERTKAQRDAARENLKIARKKLKEIRDERRTLHEVL